MFRLFSVFRCAVELERVHQLQKYGLESAQLIEPALQLQPIQRAIAIDKQDLFGPMRTLLRIVVTILGKKSGMSQEHQLPLFEDLHTFGALEFSQARQMEAQILDQAERSEPSVTGGRIERAKIDSSDGPRRLTLARFDKKPRAIKGLAFEPPRGVADAISEARIVIPFPGAILFWNTAGRQKR